MKLMVTEERPAVAVEAIRAELAGARVILRHEQFEAALFILAEGGGSFQGVVEFRAVGGEREEKLLDGEAQLLSGDFR